MTVDRGIQTNDTEIDEEDPEMAKSQKRTSSLKGRFPWKILGSKEKDVGSGKDSPKPNSPNSSQGDLLKKNAKLSPFLDDNRKSLFTDSMLSSFITFHFGGIHWISTGNSGIYGLGHFDDALSATPIWRRRFGDGTFWRPPFRRRDVLATAGSATGRFGDRQFGDGTFRRRKFRRQKKVSNNDYNQFVNVS